MTVFIEFHWVQHHQPQEAGGGEGGSMDWMPTLLSPTPSPCCRISWSLVRRAEAATRLLLLVHSTTAAVVHTGQRVGVHVPLLGYLASETCTTTASDWLHSQPCGSSQHTPH